MGIITFAQCEFLLGVYLVAVGLKNQDKKILFCGLVGMTLTTIVLA